MVGAENTESVFHTDEFRKIFKEARVPCKEHMMGFVCTEDALVTPGTKLDVRHFQVGQYVTVSGKTIDFGFQGAMHRWGFKGMPKRGPTKSHRRVGSIGAKGEAKVWPGKRMPGHMGYEWRHVHSLEVVRINPIKQVLYLRGAVPGDVNEVLAIKDTMVKERRVRKPAFPTFYPSLEELHERKVSEESGEEDNRIANCKDIYSPKLWRFDQPSIEFTEEHETKLASIEITRAKTAKVKEAAKAGKK